MKILVFGIGLGAFALSQLGTGAEGSWARHTIDPADKASGKLGADGVRLADANGDGRPDVVTGWENGDAIRICFHPGADKVKEPWPAVTVGRVAGAEDAVFADLDGDGALDVVSCTEGKTRTVFVHWAPLAKADYAKSDAWKTEAVPGLAGKQMWMYGLPFDVNADGRDDLILGSKDKGATVGWLERPAENPRDLSQWKYHRLYDAGWIMSIDAVDLDGDGDRDVVFSDRKGPSTGVWLLENTGQPTGTGSIFAKARRLGLADREVMFIDEVDINGDGRLDIAAAVRPDQIDFLIQPKDPGDEWTTKTQALGIPQDRFGTSKAVRVADLDLDGHLEVVVTCENAKGSLSGCFSVSLHTGPLGGLLAFRDIGGPEGLKYDRIELLDLDGDGDLDLMTCEERDNVGVFWYENPAK